MRLQFNSMSSVADADQKSNGQINLPAAFGHSVKVFWADLDPQILPANMGAITYIAFAVLVMAFFYELLLKLKNWIQGNQASTGKEIPSPPAYPILRHFPYFWKEYPLDERFLGWANLFKKEGIFKFDPLLGNTRICVFNEEFVKHVLVSNCYRYAQTNIMRSVFPSIKGGLFDSNGKEHVWQRKMLNPAFSYSSILDYIATFDKHIKSLVEIWKKNTENSITGVAEIDIFRDFNRLTLDVIGETAFGYEFKTLLSGDTEISRAVETIIKGRLSVATRVMLRFIPFYEKIPLKKNLEMKRALELTHSVVQEVIQQRREKLRQGMDENVDIGSDFLAKMMRMQDEETDRKMTDELLHSEVYTFMIAGHETTSVALTWIFYLLAKHPDVQDKARQESRAVLENNQAVSRNDLENLKYITAVIKESLRMYAPATMIMRETVKEDKLGEYVIPKGHLVMVLVSVLHHLDKNWANHRQFVPERFLKEDEQSAEVSNYNFMPFSSGPRSCIGQKFSMAEMKITVAKLLKTFRFEIDPKHPTVSTCQRLTMKPSPLPMLRVTLLDD